MPSINRSMRCVWGWCGVGGTKVEGGNLEGGTQNLLGEVNGQKRWAHRTVKEWRLRKTNLTT